ncbi:MAG: hypothetical protein KGM17_02380 [Sphingomonadales bacterium]|nr:hypothetical protein [Sphingomonadales bacterium]
MQDVERAIAEIAGIRSRLAESSQFRGYSPESLGVIGMIAVVLGVVLAVRPAIAPTLAAQVLAWGTLMLAASVSLTVEALVRARGRHGALALDMARAVLKGMLPFTVTGAATAIALVAYAPAALWLAPALWLMLVGLVCFSWKPMMPDAIVWAGVWYLGAGIALLVMGGRTGQTPPLAMAAAIGIGHLFIACLLHHAERDARTPT